MNLARIFRRRNPAAELARMGHEKARRRIVEKAIAMRRELGLGEDWRLRA